MLFIRKEISINILPKGKEPASKQITLNLKETGTADKGFGILLGTAGTWITGNLKPIALPKKTKGAEIPSQEPNNISKSKNGTAPELC